MGWLAEFRAGSARLGCCVPALSGSSPLCKSLRERLGWAAHAPGGTGTLASEAQAHCEQGLAAPASAPPAKPPPIVQPAPAAAPTPPPVPAVEEAPAGRHSACEGISATPATLETLREVNSAWERLARGRELAAAHRPQPVCLPVEADGSDLTIRLDDGASKAFRWDPYDFGAEPFAVEELDCERRLALVRRGDPEVSTPLYTLVDVHTGQTVGPFSFPPAWSPDRMFFAVGATMSEMDGAPEEEKAEIWRRDPAGLRVIWSKKALPESVPGGVQGPAGVDWEDDGTVKLSLVRYGEDTVVATCHCTPAACSCRTEKSAE